MTSSLLAGLGLAVLASLALNASFLVQHVGARGAPDISPRHPVRSMRGLLGSRLWLAGMMVGLGGWALHVGALSLAPLSLVQAFVAGGLALAAPVGVRFLQQRLKPAETLAIGVMVVGLGLLAIGPEAPSAAPVPTAAMGGFLGFFAVVGCVVAGVGLKQQRALLLGLSSGVFYGAADGATKALTQAAHGGLGAVVASPWLPVALALTAGAFVCFQRGLQIGPAVPVIAVMTAATNGVAILAGLVVFGEPLGASPLLATLHGLAFVLILLAAWLLAPLQAQVSTPGGTQRAGAENG